MLEGFSLDLDMGGVTIFSGPSGCGKTTLMRVIAGLLVPDSGTVSWIASPDDNTERSTLDTTDEIVSGYMFQEDRLLPWFSALQNVAAVISDDGDTARAEETARLWLERVELDDAHIDALPSELSGGQRRRVALARALAFDCRFLLLDEPFKGLDGALAFRMAELVRNHGVPVIAITHSDDDAKNLGGNRIFFDGPPLIVIE